MPLWLGMTLKCVFSEMGIDSGCADRRFGFADKNDGCKYKILYCIKHVLQSHQILVTVC